MTQAQLPLALAPPEPETGPATTDPSENIAMESRAPQEPGCPFCGKPVAPQKPRRGRPKVYCSDECGQKAWRAEHPRVLVPKRKGGPTRAERILERLRQGPATSLDLVKAGGGLRYSARIQELREKGHRIRGPFDWPAPFGRTLRAIPKTADGYPLYRLDGEPVGRVEEARGDDAG